MKLLLAIFTAVLLFQFEIVGVKAQDFDPVYDVSDVMADLLKTAPNRPLYKSLKRRYAFANDIVQAANKHGVPELLLTVKVFNESSFRMDAIGKHPTKPSSGLGGMKGAAVKGCNLDTRLGQLNCSAKWLRFCHDKCGTWEGALAAYGTNGKCSMLSTNTTWIRRWEKWRTIHRQIKIWLKYEQQRERIRAEIIDDLEHVAAERETADGQD